MAARKKALSGKRVSWYYEFAIGARGSRQRFKQGGYETREAAINAESAKRLEIAAGPQAKAPTSTLGETITRFLADRGPELSPKTAARYAELIAYLNPDLASMPIADVRAMNLHEEWKRLVTGGGHHRKTGVARPLSAKTVRNIAGVVSSACGWAVLYGLITTNPVTASKPPRGAKRAGIALSAAQAELLIQAANGWLSEFLSVEAGLGIRRGEALALRWSDIVGDVAHITRSLCQVRDQLSFKGTKSGRDRRITVPAVTMGALRRQRIEQEKARAMFPDYRIDLDLVFASPAGEPLRPDSVSAKVALLCRKLKLPKGASLHTLRHSHGSQLLAGGETLANVSQRLGHASPATTLGIYTHVIESNDGDTARLWERLQGKKPEIQ